MAKTDLTKTDIKRIVKDEIDSFVKSQLDKEVAKILKKDRNAKENINELIRDALKQLYKYMWIRKDVWAKDIR